MATGPARGPAMVDVARLAGVSHQTVSRVINDHPRVSPGLACGFRPRWQELGYRPNRAARALARGRSDQIGIVAEPSTLFGPASMLHAIEAAAAEAGYGVSVVSVAALDGRSFEDAVNRHLEQRVGGIIVIVPVVSAAEATRRFRPGCPWSRLGATPQHPRTACGSIRCVAPWRRRNCFWTPATGPCGMFRALPTTSTASTASQGGAPRSRQPVRTCRPSSPATGRRRPDTRQAGCWPASRRSQRSSLRTTRPPWGILRALHEHGRAVPGDVSIVGFDDLPEAGDFIPPLTTMRQDFDSVGRKALAMLVTQMDGAQSPVSELIAPSLVSRDSVASPPPRVR